MALATRTAASVAPRAAGRVPDRRTEAAERVELTARHAEEREVIDFIRERARRALSYIEGGRRHATYNEVAAIGEAADRRWRQLDSDPEVA